MPKTDKETKVLTKGVRTHVVYVEKVGAPRSLKFAGYAVDGLLTRDGKQIPVEEFVKSLNEKGAPKKKYTFEKIGKK